MVLAGFVGDFGWFWMILGGFGSFWVVLGGFGWFRVLVTTLLSAHKRLYENLFSCKDCSDCEISTCQNPFYKSVKLVLCQKPLEETLNIRQMRPFGKSAIVQRL